MAFKQLIQFMLVVFALLINVNREAIAKKQVTLATAEHEPYIGSQLPNKGYVYELVSTIYQRAGYEVNIHFYPLARAKALAQHGLIDGYLPTHYKESSLNNFAFSNPFPGDSIGLLKNKKLTIPNNFLSLTSIEAQLASLKKYNFGIVRGAMVSPAFDKANYLSKQYVTNNLQNLDKLIKNRIDFVVGDKNTLADIMIAQRPHLIGQLEFLSAPLFNHEFHVAFSKKSSNYLQLKKDFDLGLQLIYQEGTLTKILQKHGLFRIKSTNNNKVKLTIGTVNNKDMLIMQTLSKEFEQSHPNIKLQWRILPETTLRKRLLSNLAISDGQFDIMTIGSYETSLWAKRGWLSPLENLPLNYELNDLLTNVRSLLSYQQQLYALPFYAESSMMFYRQDLFNKHNLSMPKQPTYQDVINFAKTIHNPEKGIYGICIRGKPGWGENIASLTAIVNTHAGQWFDQNWHPMIYSNAWKKALAIYIELSTQYGPPSVHLNGFNESLKLFSNGHCGLWIDATVAASTLFDPEKSKVFNKLQYTYAPIANTSTGSHWLWAWALAIPDSSKHKKEALAFITWATSKQYIKKVASQNGWLAIPPGTRKSSYSNPNYANKASFGQFVLSNIQDGIPLGAIIRTTPAGEKLFISIPRFHAIGDYVGTLIVKVIQGDITQEQALQKAQQFSEKIMKQSVH